MSLVVWAVLIRTTVLLLLLSGSALHVAAQRRLSEKEKSDRFAQSKHCQTRGLRNATSERWTQFINVLVPINDTYGFSRRKVETAVHLAVKQTLVSWYKRGDVIVRFFDSGCDGVQAPVKAALEYYLQKADVFVGPVCSVSLTPVALYSQARWKIPVISPGGILAREEHIDHSISKATATTLLSSIQTDAVTTFLFQIFKMHNWTKFVFLYDWKGPVWIETSYCEMFNFEVSKHATENSYYNHLRKPYRMLDDAFETLDNHVSTKFAIIVLCGDPDDVRKIMLRALDKGFLNGEYLFIDLDLHSSEQRLRRAWYRETDSVEVNEKARKAFRNLWIISSFRNTTEEYRSLMGLSLASYKRVAGNITERDTQQMWNYVGSFYDSIALYSTALKDAMTVGEDEIRRMNAHGDERTRFNLLVMRYLRNRTFLGINGPLRIGESGSRVTTYSLLTYQPSKDQFDAIVSFRSDTQNLTRLYGGAVTWFSDRPISDTPTCGFDGSGCVKFVDVPEWVLVVAGFGVLIAVVLPISARYFRLNKADVKLSATNWKIRWDEIEPIQPSKFVNPRVTASVISIPRLFLAPDVTTPLTSGVFDDVMQRRSSVFPGFALNGVSRALQNGKTQSDRANNNVTNNNANNGNMNSKHSVFPKFGICNGMLVALKKTRRNRLELDDELQEEICKIKELNDNHICRFIGICLEVPHQCIVTEYCQRGSLSDILENETLKLDWLFRFSFIQDIVRGMEYLHRNYGPHGNLTSSNCVVDTRFVVKLTDFGFRSLFTRSRSIVGSSPKLSDFYCANLSKEDDRRKLANYLYRAPEHLRSASYEPSFEGDVYSFGIICQEIIYCKGPFHTAASKLSLKDILRRVAVCNGEPFRPTLDVGDVTQLVRDPAIANNIVRLVRRCWQEFSFDRPTFNILSIAMRKMRGGNIDVLDSLLLRMEQYANNLESLVEERTKDYLTEKRKAEDLLYTILPRCVAVQLIRNEPVTAESYDSVTIYLSDICGFTALSANSSAMDVVMMLNDLYTLFDSTIVHFDVYKVETIGDAYMVVSGLPERNGNLHAREIARLSLRIVEAVQLFKIRHKPDSTLRVRIGVHTGPVCAGVVGLKMPRFCLFGDTVTIAGEMEHTSIPMKVHISQTTKAVLDTFGSFVLDRAGDVEVHRGILATWWLLSECVHPLPTLQEVVAESRESLSLRDRDRDLKRTMATDVL